MKKLIQVIICFICTSFGYAQTGTETFIVKKRPAETKTEATRIFNWKIGPPEDTICGGVFLDLAPVQGLYDSIALHNLKFMQTFGTNKHFYDATTRTGRAIVSFYKKQTDGTYSLVYFRNWAIACRQAGNR